MNQYFCQFLGYTESELLNKFVGDLTYPDDRPSVVAQFQRLIKGEVGSAVERRFVRKDGAVVWGSVSATLLLDSERRPKVVTAVIQDITDRKGAEELLRATEQRLRLFVEHSPAAIAMFDRDMRYIIASRRWSSDYKLGDQLLVGRTHYEVFPELPQRWKDVHQRCLAGAIEKEEEDPFVRADGTTDWVHWEAHPWRLTNGSVGGIIIFSEVITERKRAAMAILQANERLSALSRRLLDIQEVERRTLASELHDELGQSLSVAKLNLQSLQRFPDSGALPSRLNDGVASIDRAVAQVRSLSLKLRPPMLDDLGLIAALRWLTDQQALATGTSVKFSSDLPDVRLDPPVEIACFRVAQEALTNAGKHAAAKSIVVTIEERSGTLHLRVCDDGTGFDVPAARQRAVRGSSLGLLGMEERTALTGGGIEWQSAPTLGTEVHAWFALHTPAAASGPTPAST